MTTELVAELERRAARFAAVATVQQAISATISLNEAYREIYKAVASVVDAPCFALMIADPVCEKFNAHCIIVDSEEREGESVLDFPNGTETIAKVFQTGVPRDFAQASHMAILTEPSAQRWRPLLPKYSDSFS